MKFRSFTWMLVGTAILACGLIACGLADSVQAQCDTCATPVVAYQPVTYAAVQPVAASPPNNRWYPGKLIDRWRARGLANSTPTSTTYAYTTAYTTAYAPTTTTYLPYTVGYAPAQPYVTSYAPLTPACSSCVQTVARPVVLSPVSTCGCTTCGCDPCSCDAAPACSACSAGTSSATYSQAECTSCAAGPATYTSPSPAAQPSAGPPTPQPQLDNSQPAPDRSIYRSNRPLEDNSAPQPTPQDPGPREDADTSTFDLHAPQLLDPADRTARRTPSRAPTAGLWQAVYRRPSTSSQVQPASWSQSQAESDAAGWAAVESRP